MCGLEQGSRDKAQETRGQAMNQRAGEIEARVDWTKVDGLVPAIVQDADQGSVLMLGYMNRAALAQTLDSARVTFFSRSRQTLWSKGETSGNYLALVELQVDCDGDTLLVQARPAGPVCHLGSRTCFGDDLHPAHGFLGRLDAIIAARSGTEPESSYTAGLLAGPLQRAAQKLGEEGVETALAAVTGDDGALLDEAADLLYHLQVLLRARGLALGDVAARLAERHRAMD